MIMSGVNKGKIGTVSSKETGMRVTVKLTEGGEILEERKNLLFIGGNDNRLHFERK